MEDVSFTEILTPRLRIRRFRPADAEALAAYRSDPDVARYQTFAGCSLDAAHELIAAMAGRRPGTAGEWMQLAVADRSTDLLLGDCALHCLESDPRQAELGFTFAAVAQGRGYATEAVSCVLDYAFGALGLHRVFAVTDERNLRSIRLLERLRLRLEAQFRENAWVKGEWTSERVYAIRHAELPGVAGSSPETNHRGA